MDGKFRIGISSCLLGNKVRWNSGHKLDKYLTHTLGQFVEYVPVCPEVEASFGVPKESFRLVGDPDNPRPITFESKTDHTDRMAAWAGKRVQALEAGDLCGVIFKSDSSSSALLISTHTTRVKGECNEIRSHSGNGSHWICRRATDSGFARCRLSGARHGAQPGKKWAAALGRTQPG